MSDSEDEEEENEIEEPVLEAQITLDDSLVSGLESDEEEDWLNPVLYFAEVGIPQPIPNPLGVARRENPIPVVAHTVDHARVHNDSML